MRDVWKEIKKMQTRYKTEFLKVEIPEAAVYGLFTKEDLELIIQRMDDLEKKQKFLKESKEV